MKQSKYDTDQDGICDAPECKDIINIMGTTARDKGMIPVIEASAAKIGITFKTRQLDDPYSLIFVPKEKVPFTGTAGWGKDYPDAFTFFLYLFDGRSITPEFSYNEPLVGLTAGAGGEDRGRLPGRGSPERRPGHRRLHRDRRLDGAPHLLGRADEDAHGRDRSLGSLHLAQRDDDHRAVGDPVGVRPGDRQQRLGARRGRPVAAVDGIAP